MPRLAGNWYYVSITVAVLGMLVRDVSIAALVVKDYRTLFVSQHLADGYIVALAESSEVLIVVGDPRKDKVWYVKVLLMRFFCVLASIVITLVGSRNRMHKAICRSREGNISAKASRIDKHLIVTFG